MLVNVILLESKHDVENNVVIDVSDTDRITLVQTNTFTQMMTTMMMMITILMISMLSIFINIITCLHRSQDSYLSVIPLHSVLFG